MLALADQQPRGGFVQEVSTIGFGLPRNGFRFSREAEVLPA